MKIEVLDHGYVELIELWGHGRGGTDDRIEYDDGPVPVRDDDFEVGIIEAARQSTQGSFRGWDEDARLLKYLSDHKHGTPFEFAGMVIEVQAPIFVFREWHRHRTQSYNEMSARYAPLPDLYYQPDFQNVLQRGTQSNANKQAGSSGNLTGYYTERWLSRLGGLYFEMEKLYQDALQMGVPKELARLSMPVGHYSRMRASTNLRNWLQFLTLRTDPAAQWEIQQYARAVERILEKSFPQTLKLWKSSTHQL